MLSTQTQTTINSLTGKRGIPYEKISNKRRFQLIKKVSPKPKTLLAAGNTDNPEGGS